MHLGISDDRAMTSSHDPDTLGLISFDLDGTMEFGDPAGPVSTTTVNALQASGYLIGSCSDRTHREQSLMFPAPLYLHVGDTDIDQHYARVAGFDFAFAWDFSPEQLIPSLQGVDKPRHRHRLENATTSPTPGKERLSK
jgi:hypothetical protein